MKLEGRGGNKVQLLVRKTFSSESLCQLQANKMIKLREIANECGLFYVPEIYKIEGNFYEMEYVEGRELNDTYMEYEPEHLGEILIRIMKSIGTYKQSGEEGILDYVEKQMTQGHCKHLWDREQAVNYSRILERTCKWRFSHGDFTFDNIIDDGKRFTLIDCISHENGESLIWDAVKLLQTTAINWNSIKHNGFAGKRTFKMVALNEYFVNKFSPLFGPNILKLYFKYILCMVAGFTNQALLLNYAKKSEAGLLELVL